MKPILALVLVLALAACAAPTGNNGVLSAQDPLAAELQGVGLRNVQHVRRNANLVTGSATTNQAQRVRFMYDTSTGVLRTWVIEPVF